MNISAVVKQYRSIQGIVRDALVNVSLELRRGEVLTVVGPSGCGKSTLLRLIAGIEAVTRGDMKFIGGKKPRIGLVFQQNTVFPWRTVRDNLTYAFMTRGGKQREKEQVALELCDLVDLSPDVLTRFPKELSGGEVRRVALGMAIGNRPELLLLDEPTSQLDYFTRGRIQQTIQRLWMRGGITIIHVTHDLDEAILLGDRILLLDEGLERGIVRVEFDRPRSMETIKEKKFAKYRDELIELFAGGRRMLAPSGLPLDIARRDFGL